MTVAEMVKKLGGGEFDHISDEDIAFWEEFVTPLVSKKRFGKLYNHAKALLICHKIALSGGSDNGMGSLGKVKNGFTAASVSDGGTSITYASVGAGNTAANAEFGMTVYGMQYLQLYRQCIVPIICSGEEVLHG